MANRWESTLMANLPANPTYPPGREKITAAFKELLGKKDFGSITTAEIARTATVTEGLIYKYFRTKRELLYQVLQEHFERFIEKTESALIGVQGALSKLRAITRSYVQSYNEDRVLARMLLLEVRNSPDFFQSEAYRLVRVHSQRVHAIIEEGVLNGEIRSDIKPAAIRTAIFGAIEHSCLSGIIFDREIAIDEVVENICRIVFEGIAPKKSG